MLSNILSPELIESLSWTFLHSIWQLSIVAVVLSFILSKNDNKPDFRYIVSFICLGVAVILPLFTFAIYYHTPHTSLAGIQSSLIYQAQLSANALATDSAINNSIVSTYGSLIVNAWLIGSVLFLFRLLGGMLYVKNLVKKSIPASQEWTTILTKLKSKFSINRAVDVKQAAGLNSPIVTGFFKPMILFPIGLANQLSMEDVEAILAHELAHIKRHDYLLNVIQIIAESLFYFHPGIWYISSKINEERENCCDDIAISRVSGSTSYAKTLLKLQEIKIQNISPALAFAGQGSTFRNRIERILGYNNQSASRKNRIGILAIMLCAILIGAQSFNMSDNKVQAEYDLYVIDDCPMDANDIKYYLDTIPDQKTFKIKKKSQEEDIEMQMDNGEITSLKIDGEDIPESEFEKYSDVIDRLRPSEDKEIITLFPDCHDDLGSIYFFDNLNERTINLDSLVTALKKEPFDFEKFDFGFLDHDFEKFEELMVDSLRQKIMEDGNVFKELEIRKHFDIDSIFDLLPDKRAFKFFDNDGHSKSYGFHFDNIEELNSDSVLSKLMKEGHVFKHFDMREYIDLDSLMDTMKDNMAFKFFDGDDLGKSFHFKKFEFPNHFKHYQFDTDDELDIPQLRPQKVSDIISRSLLRDELIDSRNISKVEITSKHLKINGEKQPTNLWKKYKNMYERNTGITIEKKSKIEITIDPSKVKYFPQKAISI